MVVVMMVSAATGGILFQGLPAAGRNTREIVGKDLSGKELKLSDFRGRVVLLVFWTDGDDDLQWQATLKRLQQRFPNQALSVLGVSGDESRVTARTVAARAGIHHVWYDGLNGQLADAWDIDFSPTIILIDQHGRAVEQWEGFLDEAEAVAAIQQLLQDTAKQR
jgi:peroxiredoxin